MGADDPELAELQRPEREIDTLPPGEQIELQFALGKVQGDLGDQAGAFAHFRAGNDLQRRRIRYDEAETLALLERIRATFSRDLMRALEGRGNPDARPIFVVGMMRSGTSSAEQILASHPQVFGAGELDLFERALAHELDGAQGAVPGGIRDTRCGSLAVDRPRLSGAGRAAGRGPRVDKMPANFRIWADPADPAPGAHRPMPARSGGYLPLVLYQAVRPRAVVRHDL